MLLRQTATANRDRGRDAGRGPEERAASPGRFGGTVAERRDLLLLDARADGGPQVLALFRGPRRSFTSVCHERFDASDVGRALDACAEVFGDVRLDVGGERALRRVVALGFGEMAGVGHGSSSLMSARRARHSCARAVPGAMPVICAISSWE